MTNNPLSKFTFNFVGHGHYKVTYTTERGDYWKATINDMTLIDDTKNSEEPKKKNINALRDRVKSVGSHYNKHGVLID